MELTNIYDNELNIKIKAYLCGEIGREVNFIIA
jgi:hypothetical protein